MSLAARDDASAAGGVGQVVASSRFPAHGFFRVPQLFLSQGVHLSAQVAIDALRVPDLSGLQHRR